MIHVLIERANLAEATELARSVYTEITKAGRYALLDAPGDLRVSQTGRPLSEIDVLVQAREVKNINLNTAS